jgi:hypothetical protein
MGLIRKYMSVSTMGIVNYRNDSERQAAAERSKSKAYKARTTSEREVAERDLELRKREIELMERRLREQGE